MPKAVNPKDTSRAFAYEFWMKAPNPMVTFFKTLDVTNLIRVSRRRGLKFNMLLDWCIGKAAAGVKEFYILPVGDQLIDRACVADDVALESKLAAKHVCEEIAASRGGNAVKVLNSRHYRCRTCIDACLEGGEINVVQSLR